MSTAWEPLESSSRKLQEARFHSWKQVLDRSRRNKRGEGVRGATDRCECRTDEASQATRATVASEEVAHAEEDTGRAAGVLLEEQLNAKKKMMNELASKRDFKGAAIAAHEKLKIPFGNR